MSRLRRVFFLGVVGAVLAGGACNQIGGFEPGQPVKCASLEQCAAADTSCRVAVACAQGECVYKDEPDGAPLAAQTPGDCKTIVCDGAGNTKLVPADMDLPDDDGKICTEEKCTNGTPEHDLRELIPCETGNVGVCAPGLQQCGLDGQPIPGTCSGVTPMSRPEQCINKAGEPPEPRQDEDCDGLVNEEGDDCTCGDGYLSNDEACDDGGLEDDDPCSDTCKEHITAIEAGGKHTCSIIEYEVKCWGDNFIGKLGLENVSNYGDEAGEMGDMLPAVSIKTGSPTSVPFPKSIVAGAHHTCAIALYVDLAVQKYGAKCWGTNLYGQLGQASTDTHGDAPNTMGASLPIINLGSQAVPDAIAVGDFHTCALLLNGSVKCWGDSQYGQLGQGDTEPRGDGVNGMGAQVNDMGDNLPAVNLGNGKTALAIAAGASHSCAILADGRVKCWGNNGNGQLGLGNTTLLGDNPGEMGDSLFYVSLGAGKTAVAITAGDYHTCVLLDDASVKCWGYNYYGQLGLGDTEDRGDEAAEMSNLPAVDLGKGKSATAIAAGSWHTCALLNDRTIKCWGKNEGGQLGLGLSDMMSQSLGDEPGEMGDNLPPVDLGAGKLAVRLTAGGDHSCAGVSDGTVKCWGLNDAGQLGLGDTENRGDGPDEMGDKLPAIQLSSYIW